MFVPRTLCNFGDLVMHLNEQGVAIRVDSERQTIEAGVLRLHWDSDPYLHLTRPIATGITAERADAVASAIARIDHAAKLPVLDFDASTGTLSLRVTTVLLVDGIRVDLLEALLGGVEERVRELKEALRDVLDHGTFPPA